MEARTLGPEVCVQPLNLTTVLDLAGDGLTALGDDAVLVSDPALIEQILVSDFRSFRKGRAAQRMAGMLGRGSLLLDGDDWKQRRRLVQPAFKKRQIEAIYDAVVERTVDHANRWIRVGRQDLRPALLSLFVELTVHNLFKASVDERMGELIDAWETIFAFLADRFVDKEVPLEVEDARQTIADTLWELIGEKRRTGDDGSLLAMLIAARHEDGGQLTDQELRDEVMTIFVGGYETSATALLFALGLLSRHPDVARRHRAEVGARCGDRRVQGADLPAMTLNRNIVSETMRLFPPSWLFTREATTDIVLRDTVLPAGTQVLISPWAVHHDRELWPNPEGFDPDRFDQPVTPMSFIPFGGGPRKCLGSHYATAELQVMLATLVRVARFELAPGVGLVPEARLGLMPASPIVMDVRVEPTRSLGLPSDFAGADRVV